MSDIKCPCCKNKKEDEFIVVKYRRFDDGHLFQGIDSYDEYYCKKCGNLFAIKRDN